LPLTVFFGGSCEIIDIFNTGYTHRRVAKPFPDDIRFPVWMWQNQVMSEFFEWCREIPNSPNLFGMDCYSLFESKRLVLQFLEAHDPKFAKECADRRVPIYILRGSRQTRHALDWATILPVPQLQLTEFGADPDSSTATV
jgi:hypothetical protein